MTVAGSESFTISTACIVSAEFILDIPKNRDARTGNDGITLIVQGKILAAVGDDAPIDNTRQIALWSTVPSGRADCYRNVTLKNVRGKVVVREYNLPNAFVADYRENFSDKAGVGTFTLKIKQKKERIEHVEVSGGYLD